MRRVLLFMLLISIYLVSGCGCNNNTAKIKAVFNGMKNKTFIIEEIVPGRFIFIDSVKTNSKGKFTFKYKFRDDNPTFLRIFRSDNDHITLLVSPGEQLTINSIINLANNYTVEGSEGSSLVRELNLATLETYAKANELSSTYNSTTIESQRTDIERKWAELNINQKRKGIDFLVHNSKSLASIIVLYQNFFNGISVFGNKNDFAYFSMIADSLSTVYPTSPHVKNLVKNVENRTDAINRLQSIIKVDEVLPNINLPDIYGVDRDLNSIKGKVILLVFWSSTTPNSAMINNELKRLYTSVKDSGFEIYQVSLDKDQYQWLTAMVQQNLPWVSVRDEGGSFAVSAKTYQISTIPFNYLISKDGIIEAKNIWGPDLARKVEDLVRK